MNKIVDTSKETEVYHLIMKCADIFMRLSCNIPKQLLEVVQHIHGALDDSAYQVYQASNIFEKTEKLTCLDTAQREVFYLYNRIEYLVKTRAISIGQANEFILSLREVHAQIGRWITSIKRS